MKTLSLGETSCESDLQIVATALKVSRKVAFVTGAGVSCSAGIPDFRSADGLYALVKSENPNTVVKGQDLFDQNLFRDSDSTKLFYQFMAGLRKATLEAGPTPVHHLIRQIRDKKRLLRCYTQNIDGLEARAGLDASPGPKSEVVLLHGDIHSLKCQACQQQSAWDDEDEQVLAKGKPPQCRPCAEEASLRKALGKRERPVGVKRPNIVLYGQDHPNGDAIGACLAKDVRQAPNMLIVAGTSLKVVGIKQLVKTLAKAVRAKNGTVIFVNKTAPAASQWSSVFDYFIECDTDSWVADLHLRIPRFFEVQSRLPTGTRAIRQKTKPTPKLDTQVKLAKPLPALTRSTPLPTMATTSSLGNRLYREPSTSSICSEFTTSDDDFSEPFSFSQERLGDAFAPDAQTVISLESP